MRHFSDPVFGGKLEMEREQWKGIGVAKFSKSPTKFSGGLYMFLVLWEREVINEDYCKTDTTSN